MKTVITILLLLTCYSFSIAQLSDSTVYKRYHSVKNVTDVKYVHNFYSNGNLKSEGWLVLEKSSAESEIIQVTKWEKYDIIEHKFGVWKRYHKNGSLAGVDTFGVDVNEVSRQYDYNEKGQLTKIVMVKQAVSVDKIIHNWVTYKIEDIEWINFRYYDNEVIRKEENFKNDYKKHGMWSWYKNGKLIKTKKYSDNKLVEKKKYDI